MNSINEQKQTYPIVIIGSGPVALAPLIDPNVHSCGTVYPHGVE